MSQVEVNTMVNSVDVNVSTNTIDIDNSSGNILVIPQTLTNIVEIVTPGPQGPIGPSVDTGSFVTTSSFNAFTSSYNTGSFTGSFIGNGSGLFGVISASYSNASSFAISASRAISASFAQTSSYSTNINGITGYIPLYTSNNSLSSSNIHQSNSYSTIINREFGTALNPEALFVFQPNTGSINIATFESNVNNYSQIDIRNESAGTEASSDIVATANNGDEFYYYVNLGINGSGYDPGFIGGPNDAYLYALGKNFHIGNAAADGSHLGFFVGGDNVNTYNKLTLSPSNLHELTGSLNISDNLVVNKNLTVLGTASFQNTENLQVADRFILLASGSNTSGDGGIIIQQGTQNIGELFAFDSGTTRWAFTSSFNAGSSSFTPDAFVAAALIGTGTNPTTVAARYQVGGNIFIGTDQEIWIYS